MIEESTVKADVGSLKGGQAALAAKQTEQEKRIAQLESQVELLAELLLIVCQTNQEPSSAG